MKYRFHKHLIPDPLLFTIPELPGLFATEGVHKAVTENCIPGFHFALVDDS